MLNIQTWTKNKVGGRCFICHKNFRPFEQIFVESSEVILRGSDPELVKKINRYGKMFWGSKAICEKCALEMVDKKKAKEEKKKKENLEEKKEKVEEIVGEKNEKIDTPDDTVTDV